MVADKDQFYTWKYASWWSRSGLGSSLLVGSLIFWCLLDYLVLHSLSFPKFRNMCCWLQFDEIINDLDRVQLEWQSTCSCLVRNRLNDEVLVVTVKISSLSQYLEAIWAISNFVATRSNHNSLQHWVSKLSEFVDWAKLCLGCYLLILFQHSCLQSRSYRSEKIITGN